MKKVLGLFIFLGYAITLLAQPCPPGSLSFKTQAKINQFIIDHPNCTQFNSSMEIRIDDEIDPITNLDGLANLTSIDGFLRFFTTGANDDGIEDFSGLNNLTSIGTNFVLDLMPEASLKSFHGLEALTQVDGRIKLTGVHMTNFEGLNNLTNIFALQLQNSSFQNLAGLENLNNINGDITMSNSSLESFHGLNVSHIGGSLEIYSSQFTFLGLENLITIGNNLLVGSGTFDNFSGLNNLNIIYGSLNLTATFDSFIGLDKLTSVNNFSLGISTINEGNFTGLEQLTMIEDDFWIQNSQFTNFKGLENLTYIGNLFEMRYCTDLVSLAGLEQLEYFSNCFIFDNPKLISIDALQSISPDAGKITCAGNQKLSFCSNPALCQLILNTSPTFGGNSSGCNSTDEILAKCTVGLSKVNYFIYYDANQNQFFDEGEVFFNDIGLLVEPAAFLTFNHTQGSGKLFLETGDYTLSLSDQTLWSLSTGASSYNLSIDENNSCDSIYFGLYPTVDEPFLQAMIQSPPNRCNEMIRFEVSGKNLGTTVESGILWFELDSDIVEFEYEHLPDTIVAPNLYGWQFSNLFPSHSISKYIRLQIPGPPDIAVGEQLFFRSYIDFGDNNQSQSSEVFHYSPEIRCSFDPNDKLIHPQRPGNYTLFDENLIYTIRFQNTGNDVAYDVVIRDTLDVNLDASTFQVMSSSHANVLNTILADGQFLTFEFNNIFLPDSTTDLVGSQGYVTYLIKAKDGLAENTEINNTAGIYFDANPPVITNTTRNLMVSELPTTAVENLNSALSWHISPNPSDGNIQIISEIPLDAHFQVWNSMGHLLIESSFQQQKTLDISTYPSGVYWVRLQTKTGYSSQKLVKW